MKETYKKHDSTDQDESLNKEEEKPKLNITDDMVFPDTYWTKDNYKKNLKTAIKWELWGLLILAMPIILIVISGLLYYLVVNYVF